MRKNEPRTLLIDGTEIPAHYISQGMFCKAYRSGNRVYLLCTGDYSKECIALFCDKTIPHIPHITRHEPLVERGKDYQIYSMPFYRKLTTKDKKAYRQWKTLPTIIRSYSEASTYVDSEQNNTPESVREAIRELIGAFCNYDIDGMLLEFNKSNVGVNEQTGDLILRDCLASQESIMKVRRERKRRGTSCA